MVSLDLLDKNIVESLKYVLGDEYGALIDEYHSSTMAGINFIINEYKLLSIEQKISNVHTLKGSSANVGAQHLASLFNAIEIGLESNPDFNFESLLLDTKSYLEDSVLALKAML